VNGHSVGLSLTSTFQLSIQMADPDFRSRDTLITDQVNDFPRRINVHHGTDVSVCFLMYTLRHGIDLAAAW